MLLTIGMLAAVVAGAAGLFGLALALCALLFGAEAGGAPGMSAPGGPDDLSLV